MKNKRGNIAVIALIIVIVAITTGAITWLVATKSQAPTQQAAVTQPVPVAKTQQTPPANENAIWKVYTNKNLGYEITFPETWNGYKAEKVGDGTGYENIGFGKWKESDIWTFGIDEKSKAIYQQELKNNPTNLVYLGDGRNGNALLCSGACCKVGATTNIIDFGSDSFGKARCDEVPSIIKTFKSIPLVADETANWKTYVNEKYGFEFKYPEFLAPVSSNSPFKYEVSLSDKNNEWGGINVWVDDIKFDPNNVKNYDGTKINKDSILSLWLDARPAFSYEIGDGGAHAIVVNIPMGEKTLVMNFTDSEGQKPLTYYDYQDKILFSLKFTK
jgi:hypothetical protein